MEKADFKQLFRRYRAGRCTPAEVRELVDYIQANDAGDELEQLVSETFNQKPSPDLWQHPDIQDSLKKVWNHIDEKIDGHQKAVLQQPVVYRWYRRWQPYAAAVLLLCLVGIYWFQPEQTTLPVTVKIQETAIYPGGNKAVVSLDNGTRIALNEYKQGVRYQGGQLVYPDGSTLDIPTAGSDATYVTLQTPKGGQYHIVLPDGTGAWLNAASSLRHPIRFANGERLVELTGEAYFEVEPDANRPFIVASSEQRIQVLGTHFNVSDYPEETEAKTTLLEGAIDVSSRQSGIRKRLKPGEQSILREGTIDIETARTDEVMAWKNGEFVFYNENIRSVMRKVSRWYNVEVEYQDNVDDVSIWGSISRFENIEEVLKMIELVGTVRFEVVREQTPQSEGRVIVMK